MWYTLIIDRFWLRIVAKSIQELYELISCIRCVYSSGQLYTQRMQLRVAVYAAYTALVSASYAA